jgi:hypothetical protein
MHPWLNIPSGCYSKFLLDLLCGHNWLARAIGDVTYHHDTIRQDLAESGSIQWGAEAM